MHHRDTVAHRHRLDLVVGDVDRGHSELALQRGDLGSGLHAELRIEVRQGLVHQEHLRLAHDCTAHCHALSLPAGEVGGLAVEQVLEVEDPRRLAHSSRALALAHLLDLQVEADVLGDRHVGVERVRLEDHGDVAVLRWHERDVAPTDVHVAGVDRFEPGQHAQRRRLAAARRSDQHEEFAVADLEVERIDGRRLAAGVGARCAVEGDGGQVTLLMSGTSPAGASIVAARRKGSATRTGVVPAPPRSRPWALCRRAAHSRTMEP